VSRSDRMEQIGQDIQSSGCSMFHRGQSRKRLP
jgi:hypothetical protein